MASHFDKKDFKFRFIYPGIMAASSLFANLTKGKDYDVVEEIRYNSYSHYVIVNDIGNHVILSRTSQREYFKKVK